MGIVAQLFSEDNEPPPESTSRFVAGVFIIGFLTVLFVVALVGSFDDYAQGWPERHPAAIVDAGR